MYVVVFFSVHDSIDKVYGPFDSESKAIEWAKHTNAWVKWVVRPVNDDLS